MRIVLDLQAAQTSSRFRGIGRYSLSMAKAIVKNGRDHDIRVVASALFPDTIEMLRTHFENLIPQEHIHIWQSPEGVSQVTTKNQWRRLVGERLREAFIASLQPDHVHVFSLFEGLQDEALTSISAFDATLPTSVTLYDLIPLIYKNIYFSSSKCLERWYENKLTYLRRADLWLAISESSRQEAIDYLGLPSEKVLNVSSAADPHFRPLNLDSEKRFQLLNQYQVKQPFIMYTGGIDHRKNIEGLIRAFALLPTSLRESHQLLIVCSINPNIKQDLLDLAKKQGLSEDRVCFTGYVAEDDMVAFYNLCKLFVFPSWHEGFGLPVLEAMACGAAVIGANTSSVPEIIGREDALFDPYSDQAIAQKIHQALTDDAFRQNLSKHGLKESQRFSWDISARRAIDAFEQQHLTCKKTLSSVFCTRKPYQSLPRLAYFSPLPPLKTGIADYSSELLPELARHYQIEVITNQKEVSNAWINANCPIRSVEWFKSHANRYDRILYQFGNSEFHRDMFDLLEKYPGVVVMHDFFLSGLVHTMCWHAYSEPYFLDKRLYVDYGYLAVKEHNETKDFLKILFKYPCNFYLFQFATGIIVHSAYSKKLTEEWYGERFAQSLTQIPHLRAPAVHVPNKSAVRQWLNFPDEAFMVCSFGFMRQTKHSYRLLNAWLNSSLAKDKSCYLIFVGENDKNEYGKQISQLIAKHQLSDRIRITGYTSPELYQNYLMGADLAVQLRTLSRGETSGTVLDCMKYGVPIITNANGSMAELPKDFVWLMPDEFQDKELITALETLKTQPQTRKIWGEKARQYIHHEFSPRRIAEQYAEAIEKYSNSIKTIRTSVIQSIASLEEQPKNNKDWLRLAEAIAANHPVSRYKAQLLLDISILLQPKKAALDLVTTANKILDHFLKNPPEHYRVEPIYLSKDGIYRYARKFILKMLNCPTRSLEDNVIEFYTGDLFLNLALLPKQLPAQKKLFYQLRQQAVKIYFLVYGKPQPFYSEFYISKNGDLLDRGLNEILETDWAIYLSQFAVSQ